MKKSILLTLSFLFSMVSISFAQNHDMMKKEDGMKKEAKVIKLEQTNGAFTIEELTIGEGTYVFEIENNGVKHDVGFVLAPKGKTTPENHIKNAYVQKAVANGTTSQSKEVTLTKGEYVYFCPLNPTPEYKLIVK